MVLLQVWVHVVAVIHSLGLLASVKVLIEKCVLVCTHMAQDSLVHTVEPL